MSSYELTDKSPVIGQPKNIIKPLTKYQKAMLYKALVEIESKNMKFGFIGDKPGIGKTAVILSLIVAEKVINKNSQTIIVVPQNLLQQWENEIKKFCNESVKYVVIDKYPTICEFYERENHLYYKTFDIILTTQTWYKLLHETLSTSEYFVKRIVFDEIDSIEALFDYISISNLRAGRGNLYEEETGPVNSKDFGEMKWYVSASIENLFDDNTFNLGDIKLTRDEFWKHYIKCSDEFIAAHSLLKYGTTVSKIKCDSVADIYGDILSIEQLDYINSLSFNKIIGEYTSKSASKEKETILIIVEDYFIHHEELQKKIKAKEEKIDFLTKRMRNSDELKELLEEDKKEEKFYKECLDNFYKKLNVRTFKEFKELYKKSDIKTTKLDNIITHLGTTQSEKIIIFSDYTDGFNHLFKFFKEHDIKYTDLGKGNLKEINEAIENYKNGDIKFLLIDSAAEGCGLNLENTDEIIFIHRINETLYEQMLGRALRPGRESDLKVFSFLNKNEIV